MQYQSGLMFTYQSQNVPFYEWISLFTLCLAPLIAHVLIGVSEPIILRGPPPKFTDRICLYNPASIVWRYFIILDRRIRARQWSISDMAASNAIFWTGTKWDGSEEIMIMSRKYCRRLPNYSYVPILSASFWKTIIVALQGTQAAYMIISGTKDNKFGRIISVANVFTPIATFSLVRLPIAFWLTEDYGYADEDSNDIELVYGEWPNCKAFSIFSHSLEVEDTDGGLFYAQNTFGGAAEFGLHFLFTGGFALVVLNGTPYTMGALPWNMTNLMDYILFIILPFFTASSTAWYFFTGKATSTILPCLNSLWYKAYTFFVFGLVAVTLIVAAMETRRDEHGVYTTYPPGY